MKIDAVQDMMSILATNTGSQTNTVSAVDTATDGERDSYVSTIASADTIYPSENYNNLRSVMASNQSEQLSSQSNDSSAAESTQSTGGAGGSGSGDSDSDETTTRIVTINGVTYLETTTTENGVSTVTRTALSDGQSAL